MIRINSSDLSSLRGTNRFVTQEECIQRMIVRLLGKDEPVELSPNDPRQIGIDREPIVLEELLTDFSWIGPLESQTRLEKPLLSGFSLVGKMDGINDEFVVEVKCRMKDNFVNYPVSETYLDQLAAYAFLSGRRSYLLVERGPGCRRLSLFTREELMSRFESIVADETFVESLRRLRLLYSMVVPFTQTPPRRRSYSS